MVSSISNEIQLCCGEMRTLFSWEATSDQWAFEVLSSQLSHYLASGLEPNTCHMKRYYTALYRWDSLRTPHICDFALMGWADAWFGNVLAFNLWVNYSNWRQSRNTVGMCFTQNQLTPKVNILIIVTQGCMQWGNGTNGYIAYNLAYNLAYNPHWCHSLIAYNLASRWSEYSPWGSTDSA